ncbi:MAG: hypothetical protein LC687_05090 [Actinobacteria bacterium]|nr:hypothetical protein [Actinomycetota bacterium]
MKVRFTMPVRGMLRIAEAAPVQLYDWAFEFIHSSESGYVEKLVIEIRQIPKENWPTITTIEPDPTATIPVFPLLPNPKKVHFGEIEAQILNLESYLSAFGLTELVIGEVAEEWFLELGDEQISMQSGYSMTKGTPPPPTEPLTEQEVLRCIVASNKANHTTAALAHFRMGQAEFFAGRYIEAIRHLYFAVEYLFAKGNSKKKQTSQAFSDSTELTKVVAEVLLESNDPHFAALCLKYPKLLAKTSASFFDFLVDLRGSLQHANPHTATKFHPSLQGKYEHEAICLMNVAMAVCFDRVMADMAAVPVKSTTAG